MAHREPCVTVIGLGPAGADLMTAAAMAAIAEIPIRFVRTTRHPSASVVPDARSFDHHYDTCETFDDVYAAIVDDLAVAAQEHGRVLYAVPGSPAVAERTVELLRLDPRITTEVIPALSCIDLAWVRLAVDPIADGVRIVDGHRFAVEAAGERGPLLVLQCDTPTVLSEIKLAIDDDGPDVTVIQRLGLPDERIETVPWDQLDHHPADHLTSLWIPSLPSPPGAALVRFDELVRRLRAECPWDRVQTHQSLRPYLLEETYEVLEALDSGDVDHLEEELGDLLFQVYFHATLAAEEGDFTLADVATGIHDKLVRRHPHVFGGEPVGWEELKQQEKARSSVVEGIPADLPALAYAQKVQKRVASVGFDWADVDGAWPKVSEEIAEVRAASPETVGGEIGDLLFACVNVARHLGVDAETALRQASAKFASRFGAVEQRAAERGLALPGTPLEVLDALWDEVKAERGGP